MRVDVLHLVGVDPGITQGVLHAPGRPTKVWRGDVVRVRTHAEANQLGIDAGAPLLRVLQLFQDQHPGALAQDEAIPVAVPGPAGGLRIIVARRQGLHGCKSAHAQGRQVGLGAAGQHHVGVAVGDETPGVTHAVQPGGAGTDDGIAGPLKTQHDGQLPGHQIDDRPRHEERRDAPRPALEVVLVRGLDQGKATDAGAHEGAEALRVLLGDLQSTVAKGLQARCHAVMDEGVEVPQLLRVHPVGGVEVPHFPGNARWERRGVEAGDRADARLAGDQIGPAGLDVVTDRRDEAKARNDDATLAHQLFECALTKSMAC